MDSKILLINPTYKFLKMPRASLPLGLLNLGTVPSCLPERRRPHHQSGDGKGHNKKCHLGNPNGFFEYLCELPQGLFICCGNALHNSGDLIHTPRSHLPSADNYPQRNSISQGKIYLILTLFRPSVLPPAI